MEEKVWLGIDVACKAEHRASCATGGGEFAWSGWRFRTTPGDLKRLWEKLPGTTDVTVVMEPTRNAWVPLAAWLRAKGATVVLVPPEQSADLRDYYHKHAKTDRLDSRILARLPLLHPEGVRPIDDLGVGESLRRAVRHRASLVRRRTASVLRVEALLELLGPTLGEVLGGGDLPKAALVVLERYADPRLLKKLGRARLAALLIRASRGQWREAKADEILAAAGEAIELWACGGMDFEELAHDISVEVRLVRGLDAEIAELEGRIAALYDEADPAGVVVSAPGIGRTLAAAILGRAGDLNRFANLAGVRSFTGLVPKVDQSGNSERHCGPTKSGDPGLREALFLAAELARRVDSDSGGALSAPGGRGGQAPQLGAVQPGPGADDAHRSLLAKRRAVRAAGSRGQGDHRGGGPANLWRAVRCHRRNSESPSPTDEGETPEREDEPAQKGVDRGRSGIRPVLRGG